VDIIVKIIRGIYNKRDTIYRIIVIIIERKEGIYRLKLKKSNKMVKLILVIRYKIINNEQYIIL